MHFLLPFFKWAQALTISASIRDSRWMFPAIEAVHIVALAVLLGAILVLDLRLFGVTLRTKPVRQLAYQLEPFTIVSLVMILTSGFVTFACANAPAMTTIRPAKRTVNQRATRT